MTISPILPRGEAVPEGFTLPHNTTRTMADVWGFTKQHDGLTTLDGHVKPQLGGRPKSLPIGGGKKPFAGYDKSEVQVRNFREVRK